MFAFEPQEWTMSLRVARVLLWIQATYIGLFALFWVSAGLFLTTGNSFAIGPIEGEGGSAVAIGVGFAVVSFGFAALGRQLAFPSMRLRNAILASQAVLIVLAVVGANADPVGIAVGTVPIVGIVWCLFTADSRAAFASGDRTRRADTPAETTAADEKPDAPAAPAVADDDSSAPADAGADAPAPEADDTAAPSSTT